MKLLRLMILLEIMLEVVMRVVYMDVDKVADEVTDMVQCTQLFRRALFCKKRQATDGRFFDKYRALLTCLPSSSITL